MKKRVIKWFTMLVILTSCQNLVVEKNNPSSVTETLPMMQATVGITPIPNYLGFVAPGPGAILTVDEYETLALSLGWNASIPSVCFSISPYLFLETGDAPTAEEWLAQVHLIVDDQTITEYHSLLKTDSYGLEKIDPETGTRIWKEPDGSPLMVCYATSLEVGYHTMTLVVEKTSGERIAYTWPVTITE